MESSELDRGEVTRLLASWGKGDEDALSHVLPLVYAELHKAARYRLKGEGQGHTLQPTALVNEVYLQLRNSKKVSFENRGQFYSFAGHLMRHILVKYARLRLSQKRGGEVKKVPLDETMALSSGYQMDLETVLALDDSMRRLKEVDPRVCEIVEMRFFVGMGNEEIAEALGVSVSTVTREWRVARSWLLRDLKQGG